MINKYEELVEKYPDIFQKVKCIGVGPGWYNILNSLCGFITRQIKYSKCDPVVALQIKEKFGGLRFYYTGGNEHIYGAALLAESLSEVTCEECGSPGTIGGNQWLKCRCEKCKEEGR